jgi:uncharacterized damage-inducible protein DinB
MKAERSIELIARLEQKTEAHMTVAIQTFQNLNDTVLRRPSAPGGWSIAQGLEHLNRYGHFYLPQIQLALHKDQKQATNEFFKSGWFGSYFTHTMDPKTGKTYNAFKEYIPTKELDAHRVVAEFIQQQETLLTYLREATRADLTARVPISISSLIKLKLGDVFQFLIMHNERHVQQAKRNLMP